LEHSGNPAPLCARLMTWKKHSENRDSDATLIIIANETEEKHQGAEGP
jgi:hypothetical protein